MRPFGGISTANVGRDLENATKQCTDTEQREVVHLLIQTSQH